jgi:hypothetical protein
VPRKRGLSLTSGICQAARNMRMKPASPSEKCPSACAFVAQCDDFASQAQVLDILREVKDHRGVEPARVAPVQIGRRREVFAHLLHDGEQLPTAHVQPLLHARAIECFEFIDSHVSVRQQASRHDTGRRLRAVASIVTHFRSPFD